MLTIQLLFIYLPAMNTLFGSAAIDITSWIRAIGAGIGLFLIVSIEEAIRRKFGQADNF